jgi:transketolase
MPDTQRPAAIGTHVGTARMGGPVIDTKALDELCVNTIRFLSVDAVQKANSGHPGAPMGAAPVAYVLWDRFLRHNPANPIWPDRDRFVLSAGHASMLLYSLLYLTGYDLGIDDLKAFRQWGSRTPGHPERGLTPGVEVTSGPLGQGFANAVGMAIAERALTARFNRPGHEIVDHNTYVLASDGDLMEGVASEAASLAGTLALGKLVVLYDDNGISIEGSTDLAFTEDVAARFRAYGWHVLGPVDGLDLEAVEAAIGEARTEATRPSLVICRTTIGYGSPGANTAAVHGAPLGEEGVRKSKEALGWPLEPAFHVPDDALEHMRLAFGRGDEYETAWGEQFSDYAAHHPEEAEEFAARMAGELPPGWDEDLADLFARSDPMATRVASGKVLNAIAARVPALFGGSADLAPSNKTLITGAADFAAGRYGGRNLRFGVREHAMGAIANGIALHGGFIPYCGTFLVFSDYMRPPIRLAAMMGLRVVYVFTHDSVGLGEDGPTHQPVEQLMGLRAVPNLTVIRPADATETAEAWRVAVRKADGPTALVLSRQKLPVLDRTTFPSAEALASGGYVLWQLKESMPDLILIGTGSEVHIALEAGRTLADQGVNARVVSLPSWELFDRAPAEYRETVLRGAVRARVAIEAGARVGWERYVGLEGAVIGLDRFGASAPSQVNYQRLGITVKAVLEAAKRVLGR